MKSQLIEIMDSEITGDLRPAPEGKWAIGGGIEINCKYRLYGSKSVKTEAPVEGRGGGGGGLYSR